MSEQRHARVRERLANSFAMLEQIERDRLDGEDPWFRKVAEQGIIHRELLDLELQDIEEQIENICEISARIDK